MTTMFFREHRNTLEASMKTLVEIPATKQALIDHINKRLIAEGYNVLPPIQLSHLKVTHYCKDRRQESGPFCNQETFIVEAKGHGVIGFCTDSCR